jgi:predicted amidohydrolase
VRIAVAQFEVNGDVPTADVLAASGARVRRVMAEAAAAAARLVVFPEGTVSFPHKRRISSCAPDLGEADWTKVDWPALRDELGRVGQAAGELGVWTVVGAPHPLRAGLRPHNSLFVFSDAGELVTRYDKRRLSTTEVSYLYTPGTEAVTFEVDGLRIGMVLCLETLFGDLFVDYADAGADVVLIPSAGGGIFGQLALAHAAVNGMSIALAIPPVEDAADPSRSGVCGPQGWLAEAADGREGVVFADVSRRDGRPTYHYLARHGLYDERLAPGEPRTLDRRSL